MVMFKARFKPMTDQPQARSAAQQQQQPQARAAAQQQQPQPAQPKAPPIEEERGPQVPVKLPGDPQAPERAR
jgi:hypothetical protein